MRQPKHSIESLEWDDGFDVDLFVSEPPSTYESRVMLSIGPTLLSAHKAAVRRLKRLLREEERVVAKLEKGGE